MDAKVYLERIEPVNKNLGLILLTMIWIAAVGVGFRQMYNYEYKTGSAVQEANQWPAGTDILPNKHLYRLVMVAHPKCPCTRASIGELELIMAKGQGRVDAYVLFIKPDEVDEHWVETDLFNRVAQIPGVHVIVDQDAQEAQLFGATTSGQTFLYDQQGKLLFSGGITASRGHSGDNVGRATITALIHGQQPTVKHTPFFGCLLKNAGQVSNRLTQGADHGR